MKRTSMESRRWGGALGGSVSKSSGRKSLPEGQGLTLKCTGTFGNWGEQGWLLWFGEAREVRLQLYRITQMSCVCRKLSVSVKQQREP